MPGAAKSQKPFSVSHSADEDPPWDGHSQGNLSTIMVRFNLDEIPVIQPLAIRATDACCAFECTKPIFPQWWPPRIEHTTLWHSKSAFYVSAALELGHEFALTVSFKMRDLKVLLFKITKLRLLAFIYHSQFLKVYHVVHYCPMGAKSMTSHNTLKRNTKYQGENFWQCLNAS